MKNKMNRSAKRYVIMSFIGTVTLILGVSLYLVAFIKSNQLNTVSKVLSSSSFIVAVVITLLAIVSFSFVLYKKINKDKNVAKLNEDYELAFEQIKEYIGISGLTFIEKREISNEILSLFLEAQENNKEVNQVIGNNYKEFIDSMIRAYGVKNYLAYDMITGLQYFIFYIIAINPLLYFERPETGFYHQRLDYILILFFIMSSFIIIPLINRSKRKSIENKSSTVLPLGFILIIILIPALFIGMIVIARRMLFDKLDWIKYLLTEGIVLINSPFSFTIFIFIFVLLYFVKRKMRKLP